MFSALAKFAPISHATDVYRRTAARLKLLKKGVYPNRLDNYYGTALHRAAFDGKIEDARLLLAVGANLHARDDEDDTPLHEAASMTWRKENQAEFCRLLLEAGADVDAVNNLHKTPLHHAAAKGPLAICRILLDAGANPNAVWRSYTLEMAGDDSAWYYHTALHTAISGQHLDVCRLLVERGASPSWVPEANSYSDYLTPFQYAVQTGAMEIIRFFVEECGESLSQRTFDGRFLTHIPEEGSPQMSYLLSLITEHAILDVLPDASDGAPERSRGISPL